MSPAISKEVSKGPTAPTAMGKVIQSPALEWLWKYLGDVARPSILDCGAIKPQTVEVLLRRGTKVYVADIVSPLQRDDPRFWDRSKKVAVFLTEDYLAQVPAIPAGSLNAIFCWHLMDLLPREALPLVMERLFPCLRPGGVLFCLLREPYLKEGADSIWWLENLASLNAGVQEGKPFPYPVVSGRDVERLLPSGSLKSFLTRSGRREVLVLR
jgi:hypothetical protein